jgi:NAD(P)-dependent dehydrogenase (short-subunit alcohol dehydrogenase family)
MAHVKGMDMNDTITNSTVVITGITGGIAKATASLLASQGAKLIVTARDGKKLDQAISEIDGQVRGHIVDVSKAAQVKAFFDDIGPFDHLVTPAASSLFSPISDLDLDAAETLINSKQWGQLYCVKYAAPHISKQGSITLFSGTVTQKPLMGGSIFAAAGAATEAAARVWAFELAPLRINTIVPGVIDTSIWAELMGREAAEQQLGAFADMLPVGRVG